MDYHYPPPPHTHFPYLQRNCCYFLSLILPSEGEQWRSILWMTKAKLLVSVIFLLWRSGRGLQLKHIKPRGRFPDSHSHGWACSLLLHRHNSAFHFLCRVLFHPGLSKNVAWQSFLTWSVGSHVCRALKMWTVCFLNSMARYSFPTMWNMIANSSYRIHKQPSRPWFIQLFTQYSSAFKGASLFNYSSMDIIAFWT